MVLQGPIVYTIKIQKYVLVFIIKGGLLLISLVIIILWIDSRGWVDVTKYGKTMTNDRKYL